jgi:hypothetical protein
MRKLVLAFLALGLVMASTAFAVGDVVISQVYGGGGGGSTWVYDYVELFNRTGCPVDIGGWSIQYGSSMSTTFGSSATNCAFIPAGAAIPACGYYLVQVGSSGGSGVVNPWPAGGPDYVSTAGPAMSATGGKVALISDQVWPTACLGHSVGGRFVDVLGYGITTVCFETSPTASLTNASVAVRNAAGMTDTDVNVADFTLTGTSFVTIHNSQSPMNGQCTLTCGACCMRATPGACIVVSEAECRLQDGVFLGGGVPCIYDYCAIAPARSTTWGQVKTIYR